MQRPWEKILGLLTLALLLTEAATTPAPAAAGEAAPLTLTAILAAGEAAPGFGPGATVEGFEAPPRLDGDGSASFAARIDDGGRTVVALYRHRGAIPELVFRQEDPAPDTPGTFRHFPGPQAETPRLHRGLLTFAASVAEPPDPDRDGVWSDFFGPFELLVMEDDHLPAMPADGELFSFIPVTRGDAILLAGTFSQGSSVPPENEGLWRHRGTGWEAVLVRDMAAPGLGAGVVFGADPLRRFGPLFAFDATGDGRALAQAWVTGSGIGDGNDEGLWLETNTGLTLRVREGEPVPGGGKGKNRGTFGPTLSSPTFGSDGENATLDVNDSGAIVFGAVVRGRDGRLNTVWTDRSGSLERLAAGAIPLDGYGQGDPAPGLGGAPFASFSVSRINAAGTVALQGFADERGDPFDLTQGLWWDGPGQLTLVARENGPVPEVPGAAFAEVALVTLTDDGTLFYEGSFRGSGIGAGDDFALFRANPDATTAVVLREGDEVEVIDADGGSSRRRVSGFRFGPGLTAEGRGIFEVAFTDGGRGVYFGEPLTGGGSCTVTERPEASCSDGLDNDCDGLIDDADPDCERSCRPAGDACSVNGDCCSGKCRGPGGRQTCR